MKLVILIPTYNEAISIVELLRKIEEFREAKTLDIDLLVIDDNSPDRTADIVQALNISWVDLLKRPRKDGLGAAYRAGFAEVLAKNKYSHLLTMDADGSHRVQDLYYV